MHKVTKFHLKYFRNTDFDQQKLNLYQLNRLKFHDHLRQDLALLIING
jgi:hypothetical protein